MYHIKSDKRSQASATEIVRGFQTCLQTIPLRAITFTDIHRTTGISRATIYRLFDTPEDILLYSLDHMLDSFEPSLNANPSDSPEKLLEQTIALGMQHHELLKSMVDNGRFDLLYHYTEQSFRTPGFSSFLVGENMSAVQREYILNQFSMSMVAALITWEQNGQQETAEEVASYLMKFYRTVTNHTNYTSFYSTEGALKTV